MRTIPANTKVKEDRGGGDGSGSGGAQERNQDGAGVSLQPMKRTTVEQVSTLQPVDDPMLEHGKNMRREEQHRQTVMN